MAPEQMLGPTLPQSDLWALGLISCELLTGRQPVMEAARAGLRPDRIIACEPLLPTDVDEPWPHLLGALLRKVPAARPASAQQVVAWLDAAEAVDLQSQARVTRPAPL